MFDESNGKTDRLRRRIHRKLSGAGHKLLWIQQGRSNQKNKERDQFLRRVSKGIRSRCYKPQGNIDRGKPEGPGRMVRRYRSIRNIELAMPARASLLLDDRLTEGIETIRHQEHHP